MGPGLCVNPLGLHSGLGELVRLDRVFESTPCLGVFDRCKLLQTNRSKKGVLEHTSFEINRNKSSRRPGFFFETETTIYA